MLERPIHEIRSVIDRIYRRRKVLVHFARDPPRRDRAVEESQVVFFAGVLHQHIGSVSKPPRADVHPVHRVHLRVVNRNRMFDVAFVSSTDVLAQKTVALALGKE